MGRTAVVTTIFCSNMQRNIQSYFILTYKMRDKYAQTKKTNSTILYILNQKYKNSRNQPKKKRDEKNKRKYNILKVQDIKMHK